MGIKKYVVCALVVVTLLASCQFGATTPAPTPTPTAPTPTPTLTPTLSPEEQGLYPIYAGGELLPHLQVPLQRSASGEGGWYVVIGSEEGWAQFLSQMGQPADIWEPVAWEEDILVGVLLGVRQGRGHDVKISRLDLDGVTVVVDVAFGQPTEEQAASTWVTYPFYLVRVPRAELDLGLVTFRFVSAGRTLAEQDVNLMDLDIAWLPGPAATFPTPTPVPTSIPVPTSTPTPVPHLQVSGTVLEVLTDTLSLRIVPATSRWDTIQLLEGTSIFENGVPATLSTLAPGAAIVALGYEQEGRTMRAAHIDVLRPPLEPDEFAPYKVRPVSLSTIYDGYRLPVDTKAISSTVPLTQAFSLTQTATLAHNGFVVLPGKGRSFATLYATPTVSVALATDGAVWPTYISADSILHVSRLALDRAQRAVAYQHLLPELELLDNEMYALSWAQYQSAYDVRTPEAQRMANTALRNAAYFAVGASLLDAEFDLPEVLTPVVSAELALIRAGEALTVSPLLDLPGVPDEEKQILDYGLFAPPVAAAQDAALARLHRALTWHQQVAFRPEQREETRSAALIGYTLQTHPAPRVLWQRLSASIDFFSGRDASYTPPQYADLVTQVWDDTGASPVDLFALADEEGMDAFVAGIDDLALPDNPMWTIWAAKQPLQRDWRFLSPPFRIEQYVFEQTTERYVGSPENARALPSGIDLAAVLGSLEAYRVAAEIGFTGYMDYVEQLDEVRNELSAVPNEHWTRTKHWNWLHVYRSLFREKNASYPGWMNTAAWKRHTLQTGLGAWTYVLRGGASGDEPAPSVEESATPLEGAEPAQIAGAPAASTWGYVEPQPEVYARLAALVRLTIDGLDDRLMLPAAEGETLLELEDWLLFLQDTARRELVVPALTEDEYRRLGEWGTFIRRITLATAGAPPATEAEGLAWSEGYGEAVAVSIATAEGKQLVEAVGPVDEIYVAVERGRHVFLARGGVYAQYEFAVPEDALLDDARWRELLASGQGPERPSWVEGVVVGE